MNERIRELAQQAEMAANKGDHVDVKIMMAKFAELIVGECTEQVRTQDISASSEGYGDYDIGFNAGLYHALYTIKKHFGVTEWTNLLKNLE